MKSLLPSLLLLIPLASATDDTDPPAPTDAPGADGAGGPAEAACPEDRSLAALDAAIARVGRTAQERDVSAFRPAYATMMEQARCLDQVIAPSTAAALHAARYLDLALDGDRQGMALALLSATTVPGASTPPWLTIPEGATIAPPAPPAPVQTPPYTVLFVDGVPLSSRPVDRVAYYQALGSGGQVLWSRMLAGDEPLPDEFVVQAPPEAPPAEDPAPSLDEGAAVLERVTDLLAEGSYQAAIDLAIPAAAKYPQLEPGFRAAADLAADQIRRAEVDPRQASPYAAYAPRPRRGALRRGDERKDVLLGFQVGLPTALQLEWKLGRSVVDGIGLKVGAGVMVYGLSSAYTGVDSAIYLDWNLTRRFQLHTTALGVFFDAYGSAYVSTGAGIQYDPPNPFEATVGLRLGGPTHIVPQASVGFLW